MQKPSQLPWPVVHEIRHDQPVEVSAPARPIATHQAPTARGANVQQLSRSSLLGLQSAAGNRAAVLAVERRPTLDRRPTLARALDTTKVDPIKKETESTLTGLGMTGALEDLWNGMGVDVAQAVNHPAYRDLWTKSVNELGMDVNNATRTFRATFGADTKDLTRNLASSRRDALTSLVADLDKAAAAKTSAAPQTLVEDEKAQQSRIAGDRRINVRDMMDTATLVDWLRNWDELLRGVEVGTRIEQTFQPLGNPGGTPTGPAAPSDPFGLTSGGQGGGPGGAQGAPQPKRTPILFTPGLTPGGASAPGSETVIDEVRWTQLQHIYEQCQTKKDDFSGLAAALIKEDANLAALDAVKDDNLMRKVGGLRGGSDADATATIKRITQENVGKLGRLLDMLPSMDWRGLTAPQSMLLTGAQAGNSKVNWAGFVERRLIEDAFARSEAAARRDAEIKMYAELALTAVTFIALLSPAAPLAAAVLATADIAAGVNALTGIKDAGDADKKAGQLETAADTGFANRADAERARKEANDRQAHVAMDLLLAAIPFIAGAG
ncbi:MAG: hypothetical protein QOE37_1902, partial [Microbacteriaceae bacterium]|nr:hypothetical protein [Microbacteriaceae bacterium]